MNPNQQPDPASNDARQTDISRRQFLTRLGALGVGSLFLSRLAAEDASFLGAVSIDNPLHSYPNRDWEKVYRDLYKHDSTFTFLCAPNDTHNCLLNAHVKNGVVTRISPTYRFNEATDLEGNHASRRWDPRCCQKGLALARRFYGDRRIKAPMVRKGFLDWIEAGQPRNPETGAIDARYTRRGHEPFVAVSWERAFALSALALRDVATTYQGEQGQQRLGAQGYDPLMVEATKGAGTQVFKFRGGMPALGMTRIFAQYRLANSMALLDDKLRGGGSRNSVGARGFDNYSWHTDLPPGHPMVTGQQTNEFDLCMVEHARIIVVWGMNWVTTKMPDSHWLTEARMKGSKVVVIACEYSATCNKADEFVVVRPATTPALAMGLSQHIIANELYDDSFVRRYTDLPLLVRLDTGRMLRANEVDAGHQLADLKNNCTIIKDGEKGPPIHLQEGAVIHQARREEWGDYVAWDANHNKPVMVNRDQIGEHADGLPPGLALDASVQVTLADGSSVECRTVFRVTREQLDANNTPEQTEKLTWAPAEAVRSLAEQIAAVPGETLFACGMGPNQYFNSDLKDRAVFLLAALTGNVGRLGGNVGSYAGNYRAANFNGIGQYINEDPFNPELDPKRPAPMRTYWKPESVHYFNHGDTILRQGNAVLTGKTHMPTPTKAILVSNSNSLIGNVKHHFDLVMNTLPKVDFIGVSEWWWTASCEYADIVYPVDSWAELKYPDVTISVTNPFLYTFPATPLPRIHNTRSDLEVAAGIGNALGKLTGDTRHDRYWHFINQGNVRPHIQRVLDHGNATRGYTIEHMEERAAYGTPVIIQTRTYPKYSSYEQVVESKPWYTKTGRLEFYREEPEFQDAGENVLIHRETLDSTFFEPGVLVSAPHPLLRPKSPEDYGISRDKKDFHTRQARHVIYTVDELLKTHHPLIEEGHDFIFHTPKYRHGAHTTPVDVDICAVWFGPFGDMHRSDKRMPFVTEAYVDINPLDARKLDIEDGDYVYIDGDPHDLPFRHWQDHPEEYKAARLMVRARYYPGTPPGITRMWHNMYSASFGSYKAHLSRSDGLAKSATTGYQAMFRSGSHQSCTRGCLKPTWMTDSLTVKKLLGQEIKQGFEPDVHCPTGAPRDAFVKISKAEDGGFDGHRLWRPARIGIRPGYENEVKKRFIAGTFVAGFRT